MSRGEGIARLYRDGGPALVAYRLGRIFTRIETDEQQVLHNDALAEMLDIINDTYPQSGKLTRNENIFIRAASTLMYKSVDRRKRFLFRLAEQVLHLGQTKG